MADEPAAAEPAVAPPTEPGDAAAPPTEAEKTAVRVAAVDVHPPTALERGSYRVIRGLCLGLCKLWLRLEVRGREHLPASGPYVVAPIHRSNLDFMLVATIRPQRMRYMGKASIWKYPTLGKFFNMLGAFPVHRGTADRESLRTCMRIIENGEPLVMFPEGTRREGPAVQDLFDGPAFVAARTGVPIVPIGIGGSSEAMPVGAKFIKPRKVVMVIGAPIHPPPGDGTGRVKRRVVRELTEQLHGELQALYDEARRRAS
jgi:1-acyl-sn-glycerol-3-phosphate acyltransferase